MCRIGFTDDHLAAFREAGVVRVLIAFDRDEAGDRAAAELAERLMKEGFACYRIAFLKGMDANAYSCRSHYSACRCPGCGRIGTTRGRAYRRASARRACSARPGSQAAGA